MTVSVVGSELSHEASDHLVNVGEGGDPSLEAGRLMQEQVVRRE